MKYFLSLFFLCLLSFHFSYAQIDPEESREHIILKWSPLSLFDIDNTFQAGVEIPLKNDRFTIQQDVGYGHSNFNVWYAQEEDRPDKTTIKSRTQLRYYFYEKRKFRSYVAGEYLFKRIVTRETQWVGMDCGGVNGCGYFENKDVKLGRFVSALHAKFGWQIYFSNRTSMDLFMGFGLRKARVKSLTPNAENVRFNNDWDWFRSNRPGNYQVIPSLAIGFHLGIALGKFRKTESDNL